MFSPSKKVEKVAKSAFCPQLKGEEHIGIQTTVDRREYLFGELLEWQVEPPAWTVATRP
jgi:hypothetical protein